jgi:hypothetical protein
MGGGGASFEVGQVVLGTSAPTTGTWLETGKYYSKAAYPDLATAIGSVADMGTPVAVPQAQLPQAFATNNNTNSPYITATNGTTTVVVGFAGAIRKTTDGSNWVAVPSTTGQNLNEVRYLNGNFVAVGGGGAIVTSTDGTTWVSRGAPAAQNFLSVAYGAGVYVAVGAAGVIAYSSDLVSWNYVAPTTSPFTRVVFANSIFVAVAGAGFCYTSTDGINWTNRTFQSTSLLDVVYGNSVFVATTSSGTPWYSPDGIGWASNYGTFAINTNGFSPYITATNGTTTVVVGQGGAIRKTTDGLNWYSVSSNATQQFNEVRYLNNNFVAVGAGSAISISSDGNTWTLLPFILSANFYSVAYGASKYVVVGVSGLISYSSDLVAWTIASGTGTNSFNRVIFANGLFVAVGNAGATYTSPDGITWTSRSAGVSTFYDVIYANSLFVAVGAGGTCYTSTDGITWTSRTLISATFYQVIYANSLFVAVGNNSYIYTSPDGITWTQRFVSGFKTIFSVVWNGTTFYGAGNFGTYYTSTDGITWTESVDASLGTFYSAAVVNSKTIAFGSNASSILAGATQAQILGQGTWSYSLAAQSASNPRTIAYNGSNQYVAVGSNGTILSSADGQTWVGRVQTNGTGNLDKVQYVNSNYLAMGAGALLYTSPNGTTWTTRSTGSVSAFNAAAYGASVYVIVGASGAVLSSPDLATWTSRSAGAQTFNDVIFANSIFVAMGGGGAYSSPDGITWTARITGLLSTFNRIIYANSLFVAVGTSASVYTSSDGITWTSRTSNVASQLNDVVWNGLLFCAVGVGGSITTSPDGITWTARTAPTAANTLMSVSWSGTNFVVTNTTDSSIIVSSNGISWKTIPTRYAGNFLYSTYAGGKFLAIGTNKIATSTDGINWTPATNTQFTSAGPTTAYITTLANSKFFMLGTNAPYNMASSTDGITWTPYSLNNLPGVIPLFDIVWNGTSYYIAGAAGNYFTSTDGITWTGNLDASISTFYSVDVINSKVVAFGNTSSVILAGATRAEVLQNGTWNYSVSAQSTSNPRTIAYNGSNQYVAVGSSGTLLSSADGQAWVGRYSGTISPFDKVQYVNGNYVAMGSAVYGNNVYTSSNGTTWTPQNVSANNYNAVSYGASVYVMAGNAGILATSSNLVDWTVRTNGANTFNDIVFGNSIFVAVGGVGVVYSSPDGATWTARSAGSNSFQRVIYANSLFVAVAVSGIIYTSIDGITWVIRTSNVASQLNDVTWNGSLFCAVGASGVITTSPDGLSWTARTPGDTSVTLISVAWSGTRFIVANTTNSSIWYSSDGTTWTRTSTANQVVNLYAAYLGSKFLSIGSTFIQSSTDGLNWTSADQVQYVPSSINKLYKYGSNYYAATAKGIYQSTNGITFALSGRNIPSASISFIAYSGSVLLAVVAAGSGQPQAIYKSTDGLTWSKSADLGTRTNTNIAPGAPIDMVYANGNFILGQPLAQAQNLNYTIYTSTDGVTWTGRATPYLSSPQTSIASDGTTAVFGSANGSMKSTDGGVSWSIITGTINQVAVYSSGAWIFAGINNYTTSSDLSTFNFTGITASAQNAQNFYVSGNNIVGVIAGNSVYLNKSASGYIALPTKGYSSFAYLNIGKEIPVRGTTALVVTNGTSNPIMANLIAEIPLYSYDTSTTFWVPPSNAGAGQQAYIYAGA